MAEALPWWKTAVIYQIYPRSFCDTDGDGVGDLGGIRRHLDHLVDLGVDALWLSPIFRSPMADFGYDVADYCDIDPLFGTLADFDALVAEAHERDLRVLLDWVPNHTSDQHPWFVESRSSRDSAKRDWYVWRDEPNNWRSAFARDERGDDPRAWTYDESTGQWYLHLFLPQQPDLNWRNPEVREAMLATLRFWLDRGVDGFRADVIHALIKDEALTDVPPELAAIPKASTNDEPGTHEILREIRTLLDSYPGDRMVVGEVYLLDTAKVARYYGADDELHLSFNFPPLYTKWDARRWRAQVEKAEAELGPIDAWPTWVLSNHDNPRHRSRYGSDARSRAAAVLLLTLRGTPFLYAGEELGLEDAVVPPERVVDPGGRDGCRAPVPWEPSPPYGWATGEPWLPWPPEPETRNAATLAADEGSLLHLYRRLLRARRASAALRSGAWRPVDAGEGTFAYTREADGDRRLVIVRFAEDGDQLAVDGDWIVEVDSGGEREGSRYDGRVGGSSAMVLRPA